MTCALVNRFFCLPSSAFCVALQEEVDDNPPFCIMEGSTFFRRKKEWNLFGDFSLKILGEITEGGFWVCAFGTRVLGRHVERRIVIPASAFDSKVKFLEKTRKSFGGGTFNINEGALLENYYLFLKEEYNEGVPRQYFAAECIGLQKSKNDYWCLSSEIHVCNGMILPKENQRFLFPNDLLYPYEVIVNRSLLEDNMHCRNVCKRFIEASSVFGVNHISLKLATAFLLLRLLRINDEESWIR
ncbi:uncharacterized protein LOC110042885 isoform X2 [Orbicella faveolata]|uniref:uncharacterized protein LOC110042885 isoform X2 n=1 Tax=Orbicella faveolata TaxID=48498 RepID=UPI0009E558E4|nr:uncharacterized protein LOC110042885 isoform X2 [Orbicella faveolata]